MNYRMDLHSIDKVAAEYGWRRIDYQPNIGMASYYKMLGDDGARVNVYLTKMTVGTALNHPTKGRTQLFRRDVDYRELHRIFRNPRVHLNKGYRLRKDKPCPRSAESKSPSTGTPVGDRKDGATQRSQSSTTKWKSNGTAHDSQNGSSDHPKTHGNSFVRSCIAWLRKSLTW